MEYRLFGSFRVIDAGGNDVPSGGPRQQTLLALLCLNAGRVVHTDDIAFAVWGDEVPDKAARSISTYASNLRKLLDDEITFGNGGYALHANRSSVDVLQFEDAVAAAQALGGSERSAALRNAVATWGDEPFRGLEGRGVFAEERHRLDSMLNATLRDAADVALAGDDATSALTWAEQLTSRDPYDETFLALRMRALYAAGRQVEALDVYRRYRLDLVDRLGIEPSADLQEIEVRILQHDLPEPPGDALDLGIEAMGVPLRYSTFIGRSDEVQEVVRRLRAHRLVSLVGPGGIGKSSIAAEAAHALPTEKAIAFAAIESVRHSEVAMAVARAVGLEPGSPAAARDVLTAYLATRPHVLVLDGCEAHIDEIADLVDVLLTSTDVIIVATSREPIGLSGESTIRVGPLGTDHSAMLFMDRAEIAEPIDNDVREHIERLCDALDGMPLALELAAARARTMQVSRLAERLDDQIGLLKRSRSLDERHASLLAALEWSYGLLSVTEQEALTAVSVFVAPFELDDAVAVTPSGDEDDVWRLVDVSLLQPPDSQGRFRFLEPVRQFARHQLGIEGREPVVRTRHARYMAGRAELAAQLQWSTEMFAWRRWMFENREEILQALRWSILNDDPDDALRIIAAVGRRLVALGVSGPIVEPGLTALDHAKATRDATYVMAAVHLSFMLSHSGRVDEALSRLQIAGDLADALDDDLLRAEVMQRQSTVVMSNAGQLPVMEQALRIWEEVNSPQAIHYRWNYAMMLFELDRADDAVAAMAHAEEFYQREFGRSNPAWLTTLLHAAEYRGDWREAARLGVLAAKVYEDSSMFRHASGAWEEAIFVGTILEDPELVRKGLRECERIRLLTGTTYLPATRLMALAADERHSDVLRTATVWFDHLASDGTSSNESALTGEESDVLGSIVHPPPVFYILHPTTVALARSGHGPRAKAIVEAVPSMQSEARFRYWAEFRGMGNWEALSSELDSEIAGAADITLETIVGYLREAVHAALRDEHLSG